MLKKLLKYDLKFKFKFLAIFYSLSLFFAVLTRMFFSIEGSFMMNIIAKICSGVTISMIFNIIINNLMRSWLRFKSNLYGDESYLTHTLPIEKKTLYLSKILSSIISLFSSIIIIAISLFIAYYSKENIEILKNLILPVTTAYGNTFVKILLAGLFILFLEFANILQSGYTGIILGHKMNNNKSGFSVLYGFIAYMITQTVAVLLIFIVGIFNKDIMNLFSTTEVINIDVIKTIIYLAIIIYSIILIVGYIINLKLFKQGVNVE